MSAPKNPLMNLADALVEDIMAMSDEEILAEATPEEIERAAKWKEHFHFEIEKLRREIHELKRTRSEAEAAARVSGFRDGVQMTRKELCALVGAPSAENGEPKR